MDSGNKLKQLEMIQAIILRMASNSFMLKGWAVTLIAGTFALSAKDTNSLFFLIAYVPIVLFWFLDSYYLQLERKYRVLYNDTTLKEEKDIDFRFSVSKSKTNDKTLYVQCVLSITEAGFYIPAAGLVALVIVLAEKFFV